MSSGDSLPEELVRLLSVWRQESRLRFRRPQRFLKLFPDSYAGGGVGGVGGFFSRCGASRHCGMAGALPRAQFLRLARVFVIHDGVQFADFVVKC